MSQLKELLAQIDNLQKQVNDVRAAETADAISTARSLIAEYQLTPADVFPDTKRKAVVKPSGKVPPKYRDSATGATWTGRGMMPKWLQGKNKADYLITN